MKIMLLIVCWEDEKQKTVTSLLCVFFCVLFALVDAAQGMEFSPSPRGYRWCVDHDHLRFVGPKRNARRQPFLQGASSPRALRRRTQDRTRSALDVLGTGDSKAKEELQATFANVPESMLPRSQFRACG